MSLIGRIERIEQDCIVGWVFRQPAPESPLRVDILVNGELVTHGLAAGLRPDVIPAGGPLSSGFEIFIPHHLSQSGALIEAQVDGETFATRQLRGSQTHNDSFAGVVEVFDGMSVQGWAVNIATPNRPVVLAVYAGGKLAGYCGASHSRPDIETQFGTTSHLGFSFNVPMPLRSLGPLVYRFFIANTDIELGGSPFMVGGKPLPNDIEMLSAIYSSEPSQ